MVKPPTIVSHDLCAVLQYPKGMVTGKMDIEKLNQLKSI